MCPNQFLKYDLNCKILYIIISVMVLQQFFVTCYTMLYFVDDCKDHGDKTFCMSLKRNGECYKDYEDARRQCAVTCGYCRKFIIVTRSFECMKMRGSNICNSAAILS